VYLGLGLRLGSGTFAGFDADAAAYFDRAGVTDATAKQQINAFIKGIKDLSLWSSVVCWTLRSSQNKGSGTTAYSFGGYGTFNGTLTNGPTWGTSGIVFNNTNQQIDVTYSSPLLSVLSSYAVFFSSNANFNNQHLSFQTGAASGIYILHKFDGISGFGTAGAYGTTTRNSTNGNPNQSESRSINLTTFQSCAYCVASTSDTTYQDGQVAVSGLQTGLPTRNPTGTPSFIIASNSSARTHAFQAVFTSTLTNTQNSQLNTLYKTTLGTGLGLP
jgi:hypothetical protein